MFMVLATLKSRHVNILPVVVHTRSLSCDETERCGQEVQTADEHVEEEHEGRESGQTGEPRAAAVLDSGAPRQRQLGDAFADMSDKTLATPPVVGVESEEVGGRGNGTQVDRGRRRRHGSAEGLGLDNVLLAVGALWTHETPQRLYHRASVQFHHYVQFAFLGGAGWGGHGEA